MIRYLGLGPQLGQITSHGERWRRTEAQAGESHVEEAFSIPPISTVSPHSCAHERRGKQFTFGLTKHSHNFVVIHALKTICGMPSRSQALRRPRLKPHAGPMPWPQRPGYGCHNQIGTKKGHCGKHSSKLQMQQCNPYMREGFTNQCFYIFIIV